MSVGGFQPITSSQPVNAQPSAGDDFQRGLALEKKGDVDQAFIFYRKAAEQGHCSAQLNLKRYYEANNDKKEASVWSNKMGAQVHEFLNDPEAPEENRRIVRALLNLSVTEKR